jgi:hypothetical protein
LIFVFVKAQPDNSAALLRWRLGARPMQAPAIPLSERITASNSAYVFLAIPSAISVHLHSLLGFN